jgi:hypothetical protein
LEDRQELAVSNILVATLLLFSFSGITAAQSIDVDFGIRGGFFNEGIPIVVSNNHYFPDRYTAEGRPYSLGPTLGVLLDDRVHIRFEAVRSRFEFVRQSGTPYPASGSKSTSGTTGHIWQYPLLVNYLFSGGPVRAPPAEG